MTDCDVALLSHHSKKPYKASLDVSDTGPQQRLYAALARLAAAGFAVDTDGQRLKVSPAKLLTAQQRGWIKTNLPALVAAVSAPCWRWCVEYPDGQRYVVDCVPKADWRDLLRDYFGAAIWPAPDDLDVAAWADKNGEPRAGLSLVVEELATLKPKPKSRDEGRQQRSRSPRQPEPAGVPFDDMDLWQP